MIQDLFTSPIAFIFSFISLIIAITIHEFSHAFMADRLGDPTPRLQKRLTLNPLAHIDPLGIMLLLLVRFGWGKPVQFDPFNLRNPKRDTALISFAGPVSNILLAVVCSVVLHLLVSSPQINSLPGAFFVSFLYQLTTVNVVLAIFNLVPIHPLDGFKIVEGFLPREYAHQWHELERYGFIFLIVMLLPIAGGSSPISNLIGPPINFLLNILLPQVPFI